jgi:hypothetical protein
MTTSNNIPGEIKAIPIVNITICAIRAMWDSRSEKGFYDRTNWLNGMDDDYTECLSMLFSAFAQGEETTKTFAKRIAGLN